MISLLGWHGHTGSDVADFNGKLADPEFRRARARNAGLARQRQPKNVIKRIDALGAYVRSVVDSFPALTDEQRDRLRAALVISSDHTPEGRPHHG